jgi:hypothetical protein
MAWNPQYWLDRLQERGPGAPEEQKSGSSLAEARARAMQRAQEIQDGLTGAVDVTASMLGTLPAMAVAGASALPWTVIPGETKAADVYESVLEKMPKLMPQTEQGQELMASYAQPGNVLEKIDAPFRWVGDQAADAAAAVGLPEQGQALAGSLGYTAANMVGPFEAAGAAKRAAGAIRDLPGVVVDAAAEAAFTPSKIFAGRLTPAEIKAHQELKAAGKSNEEIFGETGLFEAIDGTVRKWLPDTNVRLTEQGAKTFQDPNFEQMSVVGQTFEGFDPSLMARYPELAKIRVSSDQKLRSGNAYTMVLGDTPKQIGVSAIDMSDAAGARITPERRMKGISGALHEMQHVVDQLDTGQSGTTPKDMDAPQELLSQALKIKEANDLKNGRSQFDPAVHDVEMLDLASRPQQELVEAYDRVVKQISGAKFAQYQRQGYEALARLNQRMYEMGARRPDDLQAWKDGPNGEDLLQQKTPNDFLDVPREDVWWPQRKKQTSVAAADDAIADAADGSGNYSGLEPLPETLTPGSFKEVSPAEFDARLAAARDAMVAGGDRRSALQVDAKLPEDFVGKVYMSPDGLSGFAVSDTGYVSNLFKHPSAAYKDVMGAVLARARNEGGKTLDAFDTGLAAGYQKRGAVETGRSPWNDEYSPEGWDTATMGRPDYVSMQIGRTPLKTQVPAERISVSSIPTLYDNNVAALKRGTNNVVSLAKQFSEAARKVWGRRDMTEFNERNVEDVGQIIAAETEAAMQKTGHAGTWYSDTLDDAHAVADELYGPGTMADPTKKTAFNFAIAITSNGQLVKGNSALAHEAFSHYLKTGRFPALGQGKEANSMKVAFRTYNRLADAFGEEAVQKFLNTEYTVGELKAAGFNIADESVDLKVPGAAIFGPKIGGGFFANLQGDFSRLTADRWLTRTMSRVIGDIYAPNPTLLKKQLGQFRQALVDAGQPVPKTDAALKKLAIKMHKAFAKGDETGSYPKSMRNPANNAARNLAKSLNPAKESPKNGTERNYYRAIAQRAVEKLRENGIETTVSDLQALVWYPEQDLYRKLGYNAKPDQERDYLEAFKAIAREAGVSQEKIDGAIRGARDRRLAGRGNERGSGAASVRPAHRRSFEGREDKGSFLQGIAPFAPETKGLMPLEKRIAKVRSLFSD